MVFRRDRARDTDARWRRPRISVRRRWCDGDVVSSRKSGNVHRYFIQLEKASKSQSSPLLLCSASCRCSCWYSPYKRSTHTEVSVVPNLATLLCFQDSVKRRTRQHLPGDGDFRYTPRAFRSPKPRCRLWFYSIGSTCSGQHNILLPILLIG